VAGRSEDLAAHFRKAFREDPAGAFREWYRVQEALRDEGNGETAARLADGLWEILPGLKFAGPDDHARFLHNAGVFFGSPGPAADLTRSRACFDRALAHYAGNDESWEARAQHNLATALANLGSAGEVIEAIGLFERALTYRTAEREIARGVTLHHLGLAWRRLAELHAEDTRVKEALQASAFALEQAAEIRERLGLSEGHALSLFHLGLTMEAGAQRSMGDAASAAQILRRAAQALEAVGNDVGARAALQRAERLEASRRD
jgi:tetratricopeptide (TPR) repeat protein